MLRDGLLQSAVGVDISSEATELARRSADELSLVRFSAVCSDLNDLKGKVEFGGHTLVTCNPPYKAPDGGIKSRDPIEAAARHELSCTLEDIVSVASRLLQTSGRLCMCHRPERLGELMHLMSKYKVEPKRLRLVCKQKGCEPWLVLVEGRKCGKVGLRIAPTLYMYENGEYTEEILKIYGPYKEGYI
jgi:tRNA1(Val) A37 N6-methylase TrmN6